MTQEDAAELKAIAKLASGITRVPLTADVGLHWQSLLTCDVPQAVLQAAGASTPPRR